MELNVNQASPKGEESQEQLAREYQAQQAAQAVPAQESQDQLAREYAQQQQPAPDTQAPAPASVVGQIGLLGNQLLAAAENKYKQTIAQAQAVHDASVKEWKAGNYSRAIAIIAKAHLPLMGQAARSAAVTHVFDENTGKISPVNNTQ
jgi:hypothetical protein